MKLAGSYIKMIYSLHSEYKLSSRVTDVFSENML